MKNILNILKDDLNQINEKIIKSPLGDYENNNLFFKRDLLIQEIKKLEDLDNRNCDECKHLQHKKEIIKYHCVPEKEIIKYYCVPEICRICVRNMNDNWESKC